MADETIQLDHYRARNPGNGALPVVREYFDRMPNLPRGLHRGDQFLAWLWTQGFKVVPIEYSGPNKLEEAWEATRPERVRGHQAAVVALGRDPKRR